MKCPNCDHETDEPVCENCGTTIVSEVDETMDALVQQASIPNLASLFRQGKQRGLIKPVTEYGGQTA
jgi:hypothetical protein